jgi:hypothetical protein
MRSAKADEILFIPLLVVSKVSTTTGSFVPSKTVFVDSDVALVRARLWHPD